MPSTEPEAIDKLTKSRMEWRHLLTPEQYAVLFEEATEPSFSHPLDKEKRAGVFVCAACFSAALYLRRQVQQWNGLAQFYSAD